MPKYKEYVKRMLDVHREVFDKFQKLHDAYALDEDKLQDKYNQEGVKVLEIINEWENKLCSQSEKGGYSQFTPKLAEKFRAEVKRKFPMIDHIGIQVTYAPDKSESAFLLKKIKLF